MSDGLASHHRQASSSSYAPVLINPSSNPDIANAPARARPPILGRAWPLVALACLDAAHSYRNAETISRLIPVYFGLCIVRAVVLALGVGLSREWRNRGGWVAVISGLSIGFAVWSVCKAQLEQSKDTADGAEGDPVPAVFLGVTAGLSALEYILFLLLLRISPPHHRSNPLALRLPHSAVQTPTPFAYSTDALAHDGFASPAGPRHTSHRRYSSRHTLLQPSSLAQSNLFARGSDADDEEEDDPTDDHEQGDLFDEDFSDTSSISQSSIIDLPPPLSPSRIVPPPSLSVNRGLDILAGIEQSPVIGAVVRRTRSARFLARSWGSRNEDEESQEGYGTFGHAQGGRAGDHQL